MKSFSTFLKESKNKFEDIVLWIDGLNIGGRTPKGMKNEHDILISIKKLIADVDEYDNARFKFDFFDRDTYIEMIMQRVNTLDKDAINAKFGKEDDKPTVISKKYATYTKEDGSAYPKFLSAIDDIEDFLSTLKSFNKVPLKGLKIKFAKKSVVRSIAKYKRSEDTIMVNLQSAGNTKEEYGSLRYIILHELGHRYLTMKKQKWNIDAPEWITTKYSTVDSMSGEEKFAELFAISHWPRKYKEYKDTIEKFKKEID